VNSSPPALHPGKGGLDWLSLSAADGARAEICAHGAQVTSWQPAGGSERLFLSQRAEFKPGAAIRGGVPVIFPQFAGEGPLPKHGFARNMPWQLAAVKQDGAQATALFRLSDSSASQALWPHAFVAELQVAVGGQALQVSLAVENTGTAGFSFTAALHSYLRVEDIDTVELLGLNGLRYRDSAQQGREAVESSQRLQIAGEFDRIYFDAPPALDLIEPRRKLRIEAQGFMDAVVWNPGAGKGAALADLEADGYRRFLCVEAAVIGRPVQLAPGQRWSGMQRLLAA
jgi:glucose-6-phosphate 1-epimerase